MDDARPIRTTRLDVAERIIAALQEPVVLDAMRVLGDREHRHRVRARAGAGSDEMLRNADLAMYTAKARRQELLRACSRTRCTCAAVERLDLEAHLRGAAERGELVVHYQPIYELQSGRITACRSARPLAAPRTRPARPAVVHPVRRGEPA